MGILKAAFAEILCLNDLRYTDQRSDGDTESTRVSTSAGCMRLVTQTNDPMGILKALICIPLHDHKSCYTDQRSDGDTESWWALQQNGASCRYTDQRSDGDTERGQ